MQQPTRKPHPKVVAGTVAGAAAVLVVGVLHRLGVDLTVEEAASLPVVFGAVGGYLKASA